MFNTGSWWLTIFQNGLYNSVLHCLKVVYSGLYCVIVANSGSQCSIVVNNGL